MTRWIPLLALFVALLAMPAHALAQAATEDPGGFLLRFDGDVVVDTDESMSTVIVGNGDALVRGEVRDTLWVVGGDATVEGVVTGDVVVVDGVLTLAASAQVENVTVIGGTLDRASGATVTGSITEEDELISLGWGAAVFSIAMWLGVTLALILGAALFAIYGGRQLAAAGNVLRRRTVESIVAALVVWVALPVAAVLALITVIGIPLGATVLIVVLPALWVLGYFVSGAVLGEVLLRAAGQVKPNRQWLAAAAGVAVLQLVGLVPALGPVVVVLAGIVGAGALVVRMVRRAPREPRPAVAPHPQPVH